jgi:hypothetical protein
MRSGLQRLGDMLDCMDLIDEHIGPLRKQLEAILHDSGEV